MAQLLFFTVLSIQTWEKLWRENSLYDCSGFTFIDGIRYSVFLGLETDVLAGRLIGFMDGGGGSFLSRDLWPRFIIFFIVFMLWLRVSGRAITRSFQSSVSVCLGTVLTLTPFTKGNENVVTNNCWDFHGLITTRTTWGTRTASIKHLHLIAVISKALGK